MINQKTKYILKSGDIFVIKPGELVTYYSDTVDPWVYGWISFGGEEAHIIMDEFFASKQDNCFSVTNTDYFASIIFELIKYRNPTFLSQLKSKELAYKLLYGLLRDVVVWPVKGEGNDLFNLNHISSVTSTVIDLARRYYADGISVQEISDELSFNRSYLSRKFRQETGINIQDWLLFLRIGKASDYLTFTTSSIEKISSDVGFKSAEVFSRNFKKVKHMTPLNYRKRYANYSVESKSTKNLEKFFLDIPVVEKVPRPS